MRYYVDTRGTVRNTADVKAPSDMCAIMRERGYAAIPFRRPRKGSRLGIVIHARNWSRVYRTVTSGDLIVYQYPLILSHFCVKMLSRLSQARKCTVALLIHDIDSIRGMNQETNTWMETVFDHVDCLICHNDRMKEWLKQRGVRCEMISLGVFDYLTGTDETIHPADPSSSDAGTSDGASVIIAGNLSPEKSPYIGKLLRRDRRVSIRLYGPNFVREEDFRNYEYNGSFPPEELTEQLRRELARAPGGRCFGLVWDGDSMETCAGMTGQYLRYNNPHKASLYIASGIPVIIWNQAALADYIEENRLGLTIGSLEELDERISSLSGEDYRRMRENTRKESARLRSGFYLNQALDRAERLKRSS